MDFIYDFAESLGFGAGLTEALVSSMFVSVVILLAVIAFYGYKFFNIGLSADGATGVGIIGAMIVAPLLENVFSIKGINMYAVIGFVFAIIGGILIHVFFNPIVFISGAGIGFALSYFLIVPMLALEGVVSWVVHVVVALVLGFIIMKCFKFLYIFSTSVLGLTAAGFLMGWIITPDSVILGIVFAVVGAIGGIFAASYQYRTNRDYYKIFY